MSASRFLFLGDSITFKGTYLHNVEAYLLAGGGETPEFVNVGLPSETVSGLTEPGHADGTFDRPDLHERLGRVLTRIEAETVFAGYGMNDGIFLPFDPERFARFGAGIERLRAAVRAAGARLIHLTPSYFDGVRGKNPAYAGVVAREAAWLLDKRGEGWEVVDIHGPQREALEAGRRADPEFHLAADGIHPVGPGHALMARAVLRHLLPGRDVPELEAYFAEPSRAALREKVAERQTLARDLWLGRTGHRRPGLPPMPDPAEARVRRAALDAEIAALRDNLGASALPNIANLS